MKTHLLDSQSCKLQMRETFEIRDMLLLDQEPPRNHPEQDSLLYSGNSSGVL